MINFIAKFGEVWEICLSSPVIRTRDKRQISLTSPRFARRLVPDLESFSRFLVIFLQVSSITLFLPGTPHLMFLLFQDTSAQPTSSARTNTMLGGRSVEHPAWVTSRPRDRREDRPSFDRSTAITTLDQQLQWDCRSAVYQLYIF